MNIENKINNDITLKSISIFGMFFILISRMYKPLDNYVSKNISLFNIIHIIIFIAVGTLLFNKYYYLSFLDYTAIPWSLFKPINNSFDNYKNSSNTKINIELDAIDAVYIIWWASEPNKDTNNDSNDVSNIIYDYKKSYGEYKNSGVSEVINDKAIIELYCPSEYKVGSKKLPKHMHYRKVYKNGLISKVYNHKIKC